MLKPSAVEENGFLGEPFEAGVEANGDVGLLVGLASSGAIDFGGGGGGEEGLGSIAEVDIGGESIAADHPPSRVEHDDLTTTVGILERSLNPVGRDGFGLGELGLGVLVGKGEVHFPVPNRFSGQNGHGVSGSL